MFLRPKTQSKENNYMEVLFVLNNIQNNQIRS